MAEAAMDIRIQVQESTSLLERKVSVLDTNLNYKLDKLKE